MADPTVTRWSQTFDTFLAAVARVSERDVRPRSRDPLQLGDRLFHGRFRVGRRLGQGGMGAVYQAWDDELGEQVAIKALLGGSADRAIRLKQEFRSLQDIEHANLVSYGQLFEDEGRYFFTMELVHGVDFLSYARPEGRLDERRLRPALLQLAEGLRAVHRAGFVHRDVKPSNILVDREHRVVLLDLGVVADVDTDGDSGGVVGTVEYMAPEQAGGKRASVEADWYAFGAVLFEALTGALPQAGNRADILQTKRSRPTPPAVPQVDAPGDLTRLALALLDPEPGKRPAGVDVVRALAGAAGPDEARRRSTTDEVVPPVVEHGFVGRETELALLNEAFERAQTERPVTWLLSGESGSGKTALVREFIRGLDRTHSALVLSGRCYEHELVPFGALDAVIDRLSQHLGKLDERERRRLLPREPWPLVRLFPALSTALGEPDGDAPPELLELRRRAVASMRELLRRLGDRQPLVIVIDDLHWADDDSLALLAALLAPPRPPRLLLILMSRAEGLARVRASLPDDAETVELAGLESQDATRLAGILLPRDAARAETIARSSHGNPLFVFEMAQAPTPAVATMEAVLRDRIAALQVDTQRFVQLVAISGGPVRAAVLARAGGIEPSAFLAIVKQLQAARLLTTLGAHEDRRVVTFHEGVRATATQALDDATRAELHRELAQAYEARAPDDVDALAMHWRGAGETGPALRYADVAAHRALRALAFERAALLFGWAAELEIDDTRRAAFLRQRGDALANAGRGVEAAEQYTFAAELGDPTGELRRLAAEQLLRSGEIDDGLACLDRVLQPLGIRPPGSPGEAIGALVTESARTRYLLRRFERSSGSTADDGSGTTRARACLEACRAAAVGLAQVDPLQSAVFQLRFLRFALELGDPAQIALGLGMQAMPSASSGPPARRAHRLLALAAELAREAADTGVTGHLAVNEAGVSFLTGDWHQVVAHSERATRILQNDCVGAWWELATAQRFLLASYWHTGRLRALRELLPAAYEDAQLRGDRYAATQLRTTLLPVLHLLDDDPGKARADLRAAMAEWSRQETSLQHWQSMQANSLVALYEGRGRAALAHMDRQIPGFGRVFMMRIKIIRVFTQAMRAAAAIGAAAERGPDRAALHRRAIADARRLEKEPLARGVGLLVRGQIAYLQGDVARAVRDLDRAQRELTRTGMLALASATRWGLGVATGGPNGERLRRHVEDELSDQGAVSPADFLGMLAPAFRPRTG